MLIGFGFIIAGIILSAFYPDKISIALIATASGVITNFIGATFLFLYNSTEQ